MSTQQRQPKGIPSGGEFAKNEHGDAVSDLVLSAEVDDVVARASREINVLELMDVVSEPAKYGYTPVDVSTMYHVTHPRPSGPIGEVISRGRTPSGDRTHEHEYQIAVEEINRVWDTTSTNDELTDKLVISARRLGAFNSKGAMEAYSRAIVLNENGALSEEYAAWFRDYVADGGTQFGAAARAGGHHPEDHAVRVSNAAASAAYVAKHDDDPDVRYAAEVRKNTLQYIANDFVAHVDRGWTTRVEDIYDLKRRVQYLNDKIDSVFEYDSPAERATGNENQDLLRLTAKRDAYQYALESAQRESPSI